MCSNYCFECLLKVHFRFDFSVLLIVEFLTFSEEVREVVSSGRPVVALESAIITHGMPHPDNAK